MSNKTNVTATKQIGERMRTRRKELGLSLDEVASGVGISLQQLQKYETGVSKIDCEKMIEIAKFLEISPSYFLDESIQGQDWYKLFPSFSKLSNQVVRQAIIDLCQAMSTVESITLG